MNQHKTQYSAFLRNKSNSGKSSNTSEENARPDQAYPFQSYMFKNVGLFRKSAVTYVK